MNKLDEIKFNKNYQQLLQALKLQGKTIKTIDAYSRAVRRVVQHFNCLPEQLTPENVKDYFAILVESHSWNTAKIDRLEYYRHMWTRSNSQQIVYVYFFQFKKNLAFNIKDMHLQTKTII